MKKLIKLSFEEIVQEYNRLREYAMETTCGQIYDSYDSHCLERICDTPCSGATYPGIGYCDIVTEIVMRGSVLLEDDTP